MKIFKEAIYCTNRTFSLFLFGSAITQMTIQNYEAATYLLLTTSSFFMVGYFIEKWSK